MAALFARVASGTGIEVLRTPYGAPKANAICERFLGSVRRECLDYFLILSERHLHRVMKEYQGYFNHARPHQGIEQRIPCQRRRGAASEWKGHLSPRIGWFTSRLPLAVARRESLPELPDGWDFRPGQDQVRVALADLKSVHSALLRDCRVAAMAGQGGRGGQAQSAVEECPRSRVGTI